MTKNRIIYAFVAVAESVIFIGGYYLMWQDPRHMGSISLAMTICVILAGLPLFLVDL